VRSQWRIRRSRHFSVHGHSQGQIVDAVSIREKPSEAEDRIGGASFAFVHAGEGARQGHATVVAALSQYITRTSGNIAALADVGPQTGDGTAQKLYDGDRCIGLLRRLTCRATRSRTWTRSLWV